MQRFASFRSVMMLCMMVVMMSSMQPSYAADQPWVSNGPRGEGYTIDVVSVDPEPGSELVPDSTMQFKITLKYSLSVTTTGAIYIFFQDEDDYAVVPEGKNMITRQVGAGKDVVVTFRETVRVPRVS